jgi:hypothetical protein
MIWYSLSNNTLTIYLFILYYIILFMIINL